jgi:hypothetical protein
LGSDDVAYIYDYSGGSPRRALESHATRDHDESLSEVAFSKRDANGAQLILTLRYAVQCESSWNGLSYDLFRYSPALGAAVPILDGNEIIYFGSDNPSAFRLEPNELLLEVNGLSMDVDILVRTHVLHYDAAKASIERVDPVALQPQDFVDEWIRQPWQEMETRSAEGGRDKLKKWHEFLNGGHVSGEFNLVQRCTDTPSQWQIAVDLRWLSDKVLPEPLAAYFLIEESGQYRYKMIGINFVRQEGCPGGSRPNTEAPLPTLFPSKK